MCRNYTITKNPNHVKSEKKTWFPALAPCAPISCYCNIIVFVGDRARESGVQGRPYAPLRRGSYPHSHAPELTSRPGKHDGRRGGGSTFTVLPLLKVSCLHGTTRESDYTDATRRRGRCLGHKIPLMGSQAAPQRSHGKRLVSQHNALSPS